MIEINQRSEVGEWQWGWDEGSPLRNMCWQAYGTEVEADGRATNPDAGDRP